MRTGIRLLVLLILLGSSCPVFGQTATPTHHPDLYLLDHNQDGVVDSLDIIFILNGWKERGIVAPTPTPEFRAINGFVTSSEGGSELSGARVVAGTANTLSEVDGFYELDRVRSDVAEVRAMLSGFIQSVTSLTDPSSFVSLDIELVPNATNTPAPTETSTPTPSPTETTANPDSITVNLPAPSIPMIRIPAGSFMMGSPDTERGRDSDEGPVHQVTFENDFYLGETEVTQGQWCAIMGDNPSVASGVGPDYPVNQVSWDDCQVFIAALNALDQGTFRLPSAAEWEYACRAGRTTRFFFGNSLGCADVCQDCDVGKGVIIVEKRSDFMWYCGNSGDSLHPVRQLIKNRFGLYDMAGNVREWCQDLRHSDYTGAPNDGSAWEAGGLVGIRVHRGGGRSNSAGTCRSAYRDAASQSGSNDRLGFRLAMDP